MSYSYGIMSLIETGVFIMLFSYLEYNREQIDVNIDFCGREACPENYSFGPTMRENYVLHYIIAGKGTLHVCDNTITLQAGDLFLLPKDEVSFYQADSLDPWDYVWIGMSGNKITEHLQKSQLATRFFLSQVQASTTVATFLALFDSLKIVTDPHILLRVNATLYEFLYFLASEFPAQQISLPNQRELYFYQATTFIETNFSRGISITDVCHELNLSRSYLHAIFKAHAQMSPQAFLLQTKMTKAAFLLNSSSNSITTIADFAGYKDVLAFSKAFKNYFGCSPTKYRS